MSNQRAIDWIVKYEPKTLDEMVLSGPVKVLLKKVYDELPSTVLHGGYGVGKTLFASKILAQKHEMIFIPANIEGKKNLIDMVDAVSKTQPGKFISRKKRYIYFNEANTLSAQTVSALHEIIGDEERRCKFILSCNDIKKIDQALKSRLDIINMFAPPIDTACEFLEKILRAENVAFEHADVELLVSDVWNSSGKGDMRLLVNRLQQTCIDGVFRYAYLREVVTEVPEEGAEAQDGCISE